MLGLAINLLRLVYRMFAVLPVRRNVALFTSFPDAADNSLAMFKYLQVKSDDLRFEWLVGTNPTIGIASELDGAVLRKRSRLRTIMAMATAQYVFHTHGIYRFARRRKGQTIVNLWHGMPLKTIGTYDSQEPRLPLGDVTIATSDLFRGIMAKAFRMDESDVLVVGQPRNDPLVRAARIAEADTVLWMPTYRSSNIGEIRLDSPFSTAAMSESLARIDAGLAGKGVKLVLKLHPMDVLNTELQDSFANIRILRRDQPQPPLPELMAASRCLITDYSSVAIDYAILGRPIGYFCPDRDAYERGFVPGVAEPFFAAGTMLPDPAALVEFAINPPEHGKPASDLVRDCDDRSCERLWEALLQRP